MIEGRVQADGTLEVGPHTARPEVIRQLLVLSIGLAALGTLAGGVLAIDERTPGDPHQVVAADGMFRAEVGVPLLVAGNASSDAAELADPDALVEVLVTDPVVAAIDRPPAGTVRRVDVPGVEVTTSTTTPTVAASTIVVPPTTATTVPKVPADAATTTKIMAGSGAMTTATTTTPAPPEYTVDEVKATITEVFGPAHAEVAIGVAHCESRLNPRAISAGGGNWGLFQINQVHKQRVTSMGYAWDQLLDPRVNALVARSIFDDSGWAPWACRP